VPLTYETELASGGYGAGTGWRRPVSEWPALRGHVLEEAGSSVAAVAGSEQDWAHDPPLALWHRIGLVPLHLSEH